MASLEDRFVIFDLDQTLIANVGMTRVWREICVRRGADLEHALEVWHGSAGRPMAEQVAEAFRIAAADALVDEIVDEFWQEFDHDSPAPIAGASETLAALDLAGASLYLSTASDPRPVENWLAILGWQHYFRLVLATNREAKKGEEHYRLILADAGVEPAEFGRRAVAVGDGAYDMRFAKEAGVKLRVGYAPLTSRRPQARERLVSAGANVVIEELEDLLAVLRHPDPATDPRWSVDKS